MNKLATSYQTQVTGKNGKSKWRVFSQEKEKLFELPSHLSEKEVFSIIKAARQFENEAFNNGIQYQKKMSPIEVTNLQSIVRNMKAEGRRLLSENKKLADTLDRLTRKQEI